MKTFEFRAFKIFLALVVTAVLASGALAQDTKGGNHGGGGGTSIATEFETIASAVVEHSSYGAHPEWNFFGVTTTELRKLTARMKVTTSRKPLFVGKNAVEAKNYPDTLTIEVYDVAWLRMKSMDKKVMLVIHEILGLLRKPDPHYKESTRIFKLLKQNLADATFTNYSRILTLAPTSAIQAIECSLLDYRRGQPAALTSENYKTFTLDYLEDFGWRKRLELAPDLRLTVILKPSTASSASIDLYRLLGPNEGVKHVASMSTTLFGEARQFELDAEDIRVVCIVR